MSQPPSQTAGRCLLCSPLPVCWREGRRDLPPGPWAAVRPPVRPWVSIGPGPGKKRSMCQFPPEDPGRLPRAPLPASAFREEKPEDHVRPRHSFTPIPSCAHAGSNPEAHVHTPHTYTHHAHTPCMHTPHTHCPHTHTHTPHMRTHTVHTHIHQTHTQSVHPQIHTHTQALVEPPCPS